MTLAIQEELRVHRLKEMGIVVLRSSGSESQGVWRYQDALTRMFADRVIVRCHIVERSLHSTMELLEEHVLVICASF